jgi:hypothetical protein
MILDNLILMSLAGGNSSAAVNEARAAAPVDRWGDVFPFEIIVFRAMITNTIIAQVSNAFFMFSTVGMLVYIAVMVIKGDYIDPSDPISLMILLHFQGLLLLLMPYVCYWFMKKMISSPDVNQLIEYAVQVDSQAKLKCSVITHLNVLCLTFAICFLCVRDHDFREASLVSVLGVFYLGPLTVSVSLAVCVIELHRIKIQQFRTDINELRCLIDSRFWNQSVEFVNDDVGEENQLRVSEVEMNSRSSQENRQAPEKCGAVSDCLSDDQIRGLQDQYYQMYALCARSSISYGLYLLFFICFGFLYAISTIYGIYVGEYPSSGIVGFVFVGFFMFVGLGAAITACNETGRWPSACYAML